MNLSDKPIASEIQMAVSPAPLDLGRLELDAHSAAAKHVANLLSVSGVMLPCIWLLCNVAHRSVLYFLVSDCYIMLLTDLYSTSLYLVVTYCCSHICIIPTCIRQLHSVSH